MRTLLHRRPWLAALPVSALVWAACADAPGPATIEDPTREPIVTEAVETTLEADGFVWLSPVGIWGGGRDLSLLQQLYGDAATGLDMGVEICDQSPTGNLGCETLSTEESDGIYYAWWGTRRSWRNKQFVVRAVLNGATLGTLDLVLNGWEFAGRPFLFSFWVGELQPVADCVGDDRCNVSGVPGPGQPGAGEVVVETFDEEDNLMAALVIPAGAAPVPLNVTVDCREDGYAAGEGPLPTGLDQWPLFCRIDARELDGTPFTGQLNTEARIEICVVDDELFTDMVDYHGFADHSQLLLGKSPSGSGDTDFEYLPYVDTEIIGGCEYIRLSSSSQVGFLDRLKAPFDGLFRLVGPQPLNAAFRRDGGVGGTLTAFSDINPVSPAYIEGSVFGGGGATVNLSGEGLALQTTADDNGNYSFGPLPIPVEGATYTVQVGVESQSVNLDGSGTEQVDFILQGSLLLSGFKTIYDEAVIDGVVEPVPNAPGPIYTSGYPYSGCSALTSEIVGGTGGWTLGDANGTLVTLTKDVFVPTGTTSLEILGWVDNDAKVLVGAVDITSSAGTPDGTGFVRHEGCANVNPLTFEAYTGDFTPGAVNTLTFIVRDRGVIGYADFQVTAVAGS